MAPPQAGHEAPPQVLAPAFCAWTSVCTSFIAGGTIFRPNGPAPFTCNALCEAHSVCAFWSKDNDAKRKRQILFDLLADIRDQRAKIKLEFAEGVTGVTGLTATLVEYDRNGISVEVSNLLCATRAFDGAGLSCFFRVHDRETRSHEQFLTFDTRVLSGQQLPNGAVCFALAFPQNLKSAQQRRSVRVKVDQRLVPDLSVWPDFSGRLNMSTLAPVFNADHLANSQFRVDDFSANGFRILVDNALMHESMPQPVKGSRYAVSFRAVSGPGKTPVIFWARAVLRNAFRDPQTSETALSFEFIAEGLMDEMDGLVWRPLKFDEVSGLGRFVFKWNLDLYREKGICPS